MSQCALGDNSQQTSGLRQGRCFPIYEILLHTLDPRNNNWEGNRRLLHYLESDSVSHSVMSSSLQPHGLQLSGFSVSGDSPGKWVAMPFSRGSSQPRNRTQVSRIVGRFFAV